MIKGIGVDMVRVDELDRLLKNLPRETIRRIFSENELKTADASSQPSVSLAGRFAVKEAVFKAIAHLRQEKSFDMRIVESANQPDGCPYIVMNNDLQEILDEVGVDEILLSITTEDDYAMAFALAQGSVG